MISKHGTKREKIVLYFDIDKESENETESEQVMKEICVNIRILESPLIQKNQLLLRSLLFIVICKFK